MTSPRKPNKCHLKINGTGRWVIHHTSKTLWFLCDFFVEVSFQFLRGTLFYPFLLRHHVLEGGWSTNKKYDRKKVHVTSFHPGFFRGGQISERLWFTMCYSHLVGPNPWNVFHGCYSTPQIAASLKGGKPSRKNQHRNLQTSRGPPIFRGY